MAFVANATKIVVSSALQAHLRARKQQFCTIDKYKWQHLCHPLALASRVHLCRSVWLLCRSISITLCLSTICTFRWNAKYHVCLDGCWKWYAATVHMLSLHTNGNVPLNNHPSYYEQFDHIRNMRLSCETEGENARDGLSEKGGGGWNRIRMHSRIMHVSRQWTPIRCASETHRNMATLKQATQKWHYV